MIYRHERRGRRTSTLIKLVIVWGIFILGLATLDMAWWIAAIGVAITLPAVVDYIRDTRTWVEVWPGRIVWKSALNSGASTDIDRIRLDRRFDGGIRITLVHKGATHTRLPPDIAPPVDAFQDALTSAGLSAERHPFSVF